MSLVLIWQEPGYVGMQAYASKDRLDGIRRAQV